MALVADSPSTRAQPRSRAEELNSPSDDAFASSATSYVHHLVKVDQASNKGMGLFATGAIQEAEVVAWESADKYQGLHDSRPGKKIMSWSEIEERWPDKRERDHFVAYSYQVGEDAFLIPLREDDLVITTYQNHSCDPNTWWADDFTLVARRTINPGEEVTFDYSTSESLENPEMPECYCGSACCRKRLEPLDYLNPELIEKYGDHFVSYLRDRQIQHYGRDLPVSRYTSLATLLKVDQAERDKLSSFDQSVLAGIDAQDSCTVGDDHQDESYNFHGRKS